MNVNIKIAISNERHAFFLKGEGQSTSYIAGVEFHGKKVQWQ
jgi:hypothetical protein